ncbi:hypothetical protein HNP55_000747 [Paucibacter oligotrophus]|uniref:Uncharacterized protein n=1 Tax=Roseateles oligotrophus TaxID=1769250 RepID=A0A840L6D9_9BURK|nr:hypothetical protein [Roseateles oligotrophus]MBB4842252.1 hypothetical protein [Roseateles oligotrophus]
MNKREFVLSGCAGLLGGGLPMAALAECRSQALPQLTEAEGPSGWQAFVGQSFEVQGQPELSLLLLAVEGAACAQAQAGLQQFHLSFALQGPPAALAQAKASSGQTLHLRHRASAQETALFLQAATPSPDGGARLQASFSLLG